MIGVSSSFYFHEKKIASLLPFPCATSSFLCHARGSKLKIARSAFRPWDTPLPLASVYQYLSILIIANSDWNTTNLTPHSQEKILWKFSPFYFFIYFEIESHLQIGLAQKLPWIPDWLYTHCNAPVSFSHVIGLRDEPHYIWLKKFCSKITGNNLFPSLKIILIFISQNNMEYNILLHLL